MNISLTPELEHFIQEKVATGMYTSASEVIRESLRLLYNYDDIQKQRIKQLNQAIDIGLNELSRDKKIPAQEVYQRLSQKIKKIAKDVE
jgi:antitoxin ParD1/3/4